MILYDWMLHGKAWWMWRGFLVSSGGVITDLKNKLRYKTQYCCWMLKQLSSMCNYIIMIYDVHFVPWCVAAILASWLESKFKPFFCMNSGSCSHLVRLQPSAHDAVLTPRACATLIFGDENEMALCDARPAMVSLWINTSTYLYHFFLDEHPELQFMFGVNRRNQKGARVLSHSCKDGFLLMTSI